MLHQFKTLNMKNCFVTILCIPLLYSVVISYLKVLEEPTTFEESIDYDRASIPG